MLSRAKSRTECRPLLIVISAPSGAGKSTLCDRLLQECDNMVYSVSCTTRAPRGSEVDGEDYLFMTEEGFKQRVASGEFLEYAEVHGNWYGTLKSVVEESLHERQHVLMDIDVQGARLIRQAVRERPPNDPLRRGHVDIFVEPPSLEVLRERLEGRGEDSPDTIGLRIRNAQREMACRNEFMYRVVNDDLETAFRQLYAIIERESAHGI